MNNRAIVDFDELEPRVTPQPTQLKCLTAPSVPEVSIIFSKRTDPPKTPRKSSSTPEQDYETYASWKKDEFPSVLPKSSPRYSTQSPIDRNSQSRSLIPYKTPQNDTLHGATSQNSLGNTPDSRNFPKSLTAPSGILQNQPNIPKTPRNPLNLQNGDRFPPEDSFNTQRTFSTAQRRSSEAVKSILKSQSLEIQPQSPLQRKRSVQNGEQALQTRGSPRCHRQVEDPDQGTVRDLLLLVQNQNEQIRSLQNQVERLLQAHEESLACRDGHNCSGRVRNGPQSPNRFQNDRRSESNQPKVCQSREPKPNDEIRYQSDCRRNAIVEKKVSIGVMTSFEFSVHNNPFVADPEQINAVLRDFGDGRRPRNVDNLENRRCTVGRNAGETAESRRSNVSWKVSDLEEKTRSGNGSKNDSNGEKNWCTGSKNAAEPLDAWRNNSGRNQGENVDNRRLNMSRNACDVGKMGLARNPIELGESRRTSGSRNITPGPLENINEDSESHPSEMSRKSGEELQISTGEGFPGKMGLKMGFPDGALEYRGPGPTPEDTRSRFSPQDSPHGRQTPIPAPRRHLSSDFRVPFKNYEADRDGIETGGSQRLDEENGRRIFELDQPVRPGEVFPRKNATESEERRSNMGGRSIPAGIEDEGSLVLCSSDLKVTERPPSPDPSIHVEMREYSSDEDNDGMSRAPRVGWTFYKNIVGQVNKILHTIPDGKDEENLGEDAEEMDKEVGADEDGVESVKMATMERLKMLGISYTEHSELTGEHVQKKVTFDSSYYPRLDYQATMQQPSSTVTETNTSMHMKALALKYLSDEQLADLAVQKQGDGSNMKQKILNSVHGTNMSLATMNYLQRYCLVSGSSPNNEGHMNAVRQKTLKQLVMTKELHAQPTDRQNPYSESPSKRQPNNILDITTLKQQPKLL